MFDKRFRDTVRLGKMIRKGDLVAVALSGGKDSLVLLHSLVRLSRDLPFSIVAISIDEGVKGYRTPLIRTAAKECKKLSVEHIVLSFRKEIGTDFDTIFRKKKKTPCSYCGTIRRYLLNKAVKEAKADRLATGHNLDDVAQTFLMNLIRNGPLRIGGESGHGLFVIRPLMKMPEKEVRLYAELTGVPVSTRRCPYAGYAFRNHARSIVSETEERYPGTLFRMSAAIASIKEAVKRKNKNSNVRNCKKCGSPTRSKECRMCSFLSSL